MYLEIWCEICYACSKPATWKGAQWCGCCPCTCMLIKNWMMMMMILWIIIICVPICLSSIPLSTVSFLDNNLSQWIFTKLGMYIGIVKIWFGIAYWQVLSIFDRDTCQQHVFFFCIWTITWVHTNGFSSNLVCALILWRSGFLIAKDKFCQFFYLPAICPNFHFQTSTLININGYSPNLVCALISQMSSVFSSPEQSSGCAIVITVCHASFFVNN